MNEEQIGQITAAIAVMAALSVAYGSIVGPRQTVVVQAVIDALQLKSRYRPLANFLTGIILAAVLSVFLARYVGDWWVIVVGIVAGVFATEKAAETHDVQAKAEQAAQTPQTPPRTFLRG